MQTIEHTNELKTIVQAAAAISKKAGLNYIGTDGLLALAAFEQQGADSTRLVSAILKSENTAAARILYNFKITYPSFYKLTPKN